MQKIIRDIYNQDFSCFEQTAPSSPRYKELIGDIVETEDKLRAMISKEAGTLLTEYANNCAALSAETGQDAFVAGYRLGIRMILAGCVDGGAVFPK